MNFLYTEIVLEVTTASILWGYIWKTRDRNLAAIEPREELRRNMTHLIWLFAYAQRHLLGRLLLHRAGRHLASDHRARHRLHPVAHH
jgi:hypothetical protein